MMTEQGELIMRTSRFVWKKIRKLDFFEQMVLIAFFIWFISRLWPRTFAEVNPYILLLILSESIVLFLLIIRRPTENISKSFTDWFIAFSGTFLPLLISKGGEPLMPFVGVVLLLWGMFIHIGAKLSLFRSFGIVPAERGVKTKGLYTIVRHPMYAGYFFTHIGFLLAAPSLWNFTVYICCWGFLLLRIFAEESILLRSPDYQEYKNRVLYRVIPGVF
jgi:protein-S-isoprenylcysteine O-methyltransferase Ste14